MSVSRSASTGPHSLLSSLALVLAVNLSGCKASCLPGYTRLGDECVRPAADAGTLESESLVAGATAEAADGPGTPDETPAGRSATPGPGTNAAGMRSSGTTAGTAAGASGNGAAGELATAPPPKPAEPTGGSAGGSSCKATAELCDNVDNDCDGKIDEEVAPRSCGKSNLPPCKLGTLACHAGVWDDEATQCQGAVLPEKEVCDAARVDENCDGVPNERCACTEGQVMPCGNSNPPCEMGVVTCTNGTFSTVCENEIKGSPEACDGIDNDCDGTPDNGGDALCTGEKHCAGSQKCIDCRDDDDCDETDDPCKDTYCDATSHSCKDRSKADHTRCSTGASAGVCKSGACFDGCINSDDCDRSANETCVSQQCKVAAMCGNGMTESDNQEECDDGNRSNSDDCLNTCKRARCGDGFLNQALVPGSSKPVEECDVSAGRGDAFSCDMITCKPAYLLTPCSSASDCGGAFCDQGKGCRQSCAAPASGAPNECKLPNGRVGFCDQVCFLRCDVGGTDCPGGTECTTQFGDKRVCTFL